MVIYMKSNGTFDETLVIYMKSIWMVYDDY